MFGECRTERILRILKVLWCQKECNSWNLLKDSSVLELKYFTAQSYKLQKSYKIIIICHCLWLFNSLCYLYTLKIHSVAGKWAILILVTKTSILLLLLLGEGRRTIFKCFSTFNTMTLYGSHLMMLSKFYSYQSLESPHCHYWR